MGVFLNYLFFGFVLAFLIDYLCHKFKDYPGWDRVPKWGWNARIIFILLWPIGLFLFIKTLIDQKYK